MAGSDSAAGLLVVASAACTGAATDAATTSPPTPASATVATPAGAYELDCSTAVFSGEDMPNDYSAILGAIGLPTAESSDALRARPLEEDELDQFPPYWAKIGLLVQPDTKFTIAVNEPADTAKIGWGAGPVEFTPAITSAGCPGDEWLVFVGGFRVNEPRCVSLTVTTPERDQTVEVGVGAPCPGQEPPPTLPGMPEES